MSEASEHRGTNKRDPVDRLFQALNHPLRRRILASLARGRGSAKTLAAEFGLEIGNVTYHLSKVLAEECGVVEKVQEIQRRGAMEHTYRIKPRAFYDVLPWGEIPEPFRSTLRGYSIGQFLEVLAASIKDDPTDSRDGTRLEWTPLEVDRQGWHEVCAAAEECTRARDVAVERSRRRNARRKESDLSTLILGVALFHATE